MLILINDNNIFINGFERNTFNYGVIMGVIEHILVKNYSIPSIHIGGYLNGNAVQGISCGHLFSANGLLTLVINTEINRVLPLLQQNAVNAEVVYVTIFNNRLALTNNPNWSIPNGSGGIQSPAP